MTMIPATGWKASYIVDGTPIQEPVIAWHDTGHAELTPMVWSPNKQKTIPAQEVDGFERLIPPRANPTQSTFIPCYDGIKVKIVTLEKNALPIAWEFTPEGKVFLYVNNGDGSISRILPIAVR